MSKPIVTLALSDDGNSVFVYSGGLVEHGPGIGDDDTRDLIACVGIQNENYLTQISSMVIRLVNAEVNS